MTDETRDREFARQVGVRLRAIREQQGLSLQDVEEKSGRTWKVAQVGSYERADRMANMTTLAELAAFYGVPVEYLLTGETRDAAPSNERIIVDLDALRVHNDPGSPLQRWCARIQQKRGDYGGKVLTLRRSDLATLAALAGVDSEAALLAALQTSGLVATGVRLTELVGHDY